MSKRMPVVTVLAVLAIASSAGADDSATIKLFGEKCAMCHGPDGKAHTGMGKQLTMKDWSDGKTLKALSDEEISKEIHVGKALMPGFTTLTVDQLKAMVEYVRTFQRS